MINFIVIVLFLLNLTKTISDVPTYLYNSETNVEVSFKQITMNLCEKVRLVTVVFFQKLILQMYLLVTSAVNLL